MFRTAELGQKVGKAEYRERVAELRHELLGLQRRLRQHRQTPVLVVFGGVDGGGKAETMQVLNEWMDPRWLINRAYREPSDEERERPEYWRYWRDLPPRGQIGLFLSCWYSRPLLDHVYGKTTVPVLDERLERIVSFENAQVDDGALVLKFWMHLSRDAQKNRFKTLEKDPLLSWQVTEKDWEHWRDYDAFTATAERLIMRTSTGKAPWNIIEGVDANYRSLTVGTMLRDALRKHLDAVDGGETTAPAAPVISDVGQESLTVFSALDMTQKIDRDKYRSQLKKYQGRLNSLHRQAMSQGISTIAVFEGPDAAGKGGAIRRVIGGLDPHLYQVLPFAAPTEEEAAHHYLWRFWRELSRAGHVTIFDRSWYGRVLVERVEGFASEDEWQRAYAEINDFEAQLIEHRIVLAKFWIHITRDEQLARFQEREATPHKRWKLTDEDWRNREKWDDYEQAAHDMVQHTSTRYAPWTLVEGNSKHFARIKVLKTICDSLEQALEKNV